MALPTDLFNKCVPTLTPSVAQCGTVTLCDVSPLTSETIDATYFDEGGNYRLMDGPLIYHDFEIGVCGVRQNTMYDWIMANRVNMDSNRIGIRKTKPDRWDIEPFIVAQQRSIINNDGWKVTNGHAFYANWRVDIESTTGIPADERTAYPGRIVYIDSLTVAGVSTKTAWKVVSVQIISATKMRLVLESMNEGSFLDAARLAEPTTRGLLKFGTNNTSDWEKFCEEVPAYNNKKRLLYWVGTARDAFCTDELYEKYHTMLRENNPLYRELLSLETTEINRQQGEDWKKARANDFFWSKALDANQNEADYLNLPEVQTAVGGDIAGLGVRCIGRKAQPIGVYEQLAECGRVSDALGAQLNLPALFVELYNIVRTRKGMGKNTESVDIFTDRITASAINSAMLLYYKDRAQDMLRLTVDVGQMASERPKPAKFGFYYRSYFEFDRMTTFNIVTHDFFDDYLTQATQGGVANVGRVLWILDWSGIYPGIIASARRVATSGELNAMTAVDPEWLCVMKSPTRTQTLTSVTWTVVVECGDANLIIENFSGAIPEAVTLTGAYP